MTDHEQLIREGADAWNRGDWAAMEQLLAPDFEIDATAALEERADVG